MPPNWIDSIFRHLSRARRVDGMWVGVLGDRKDDHLLARVEAALMLIRRYDPLKYKRLHRDIKRIWVHSLSGAQGQFTSASGTCRLDYKFVETAPAEFIASTIVHEATHAHPCMRKLGYPEALRYRIERVCMRRELDFTSRLPDGAAAHESVERNLSRERSFWSDDAFNQRNEVALRDFGFPEWSIRVLFGLKEIVKRFRRP